MLHFFVNSCMFLNSLLNPVPTSFMNKNTNKKEIASWLLYDFANTIYSMNVVSLYFGPWIIQELHKEDIWVSIGTSASMLLVVWTLPALGDYADRKNKRGSMLHLMTLSCIIFTCLLSASSFLSISEAMIPVLGLLFFVIANYSYQGGLVFYNAFLPDITTRENQGKLSGYGVAIGYIGSMVSIVLISPFYDGTIFGYDLPGIPGWGREATFLPAGFLFLLFALPAFFYLKNKQNYIAPSHSPVKTRSSSLIFPLVKYIKTAKELNILRFLAAKFFYEEAIETIVVFMAVYVQAVSGFSQSEAAVFFVIVIPAAVIGSALCGYVVDKVGAKKILLSVIGGWIFTLGFIIVSSGKSSIWIAGCLAGVFLGSTWTSARPLLIELVPKERINESFGLYALSGKAAAIFGPLIWGFVVLMMNSYGDVIKYKTAVGSLILFLIIGFILLAGVKQTKESNTDPAAPRV